MTQWLLSLLTAVAETTKGNRWYPICAGEPSTLPYVSKINAKKVSLQGQWCLKAGQGQWSLATMTNLLALPKVTNEFSKPQKFKRYRPEVNQTQGSKVLLLKNTLRILGDLGLEFLYIPLSHLGEQRCCIGYLCVRCPQCNLFHPQKASELKRSRNKPWRVQGTSVLPEEGCSRAVGMLALHRNLSLPQQEMEYSLLTKGS